jgi:Rrf2 family protein
MEIVLGRKGDYAVRAVLDLAQHYGGGRRKAREIASAMRIPPSYLPQILAELVRAGLMVATAGKDGGYELAGPPGDITLLDVVEVAEGPVALQRCLLRDVPCARAGYCAAHDTWASAQRALTDRLAATTFADLVRKDAARRGARAVGEMGGRRRRSTAARPTNSS